MSAPKKKWFPKLQCFEMFDVLYENNIFVLGRIILTACFPVNLKNELDIPMRICPV